MQRYTLRSSVHKSILKSYILHVTLTHNFYLDSRLTKQQLILELWKTNNVNQAQISGGREGRYNLCCIITMQQPFNHRQLYLCWQLPSLAFYEKLRHCAQRIFLRFLSPVIIKVSSMFLHCFLVMSCWVCLYLSKTVFGHPLWESSRQLYLCQNLWLHV